MRGGSRSGIAVSCVLTLAFLSMILQKGGEYSHNRETSPLHPDLNHTQANRKTIKRPDPLPAAPQYALAEDEDIRKGACPRCDAEK